MMSIFTALLEACDPARDCFRAYRLEPAARRAHPPHGQKIGRIA